MERSEGVRVQSKREFDLLLQGPVHRSSPTLSLQRDVEEQEDDGDRNNAFGGGVTRSGAIASSNSRILASVVSYELHLA